MSDDLLEDIHGYAAARRIRLASKAREQVSDLGLTYGDLRHGLMRATSCTSSTGSQQEVTTYQRSGDTLAMMVVFQDGLLLTELR